MTISLPGASKFGLLGRKKADKAEKPRARHTLEGEQIAKLFDKSARTATPVKPAKISETEAREQDRLTSLRGALYSKD